MDDLKLIILEDDPIYQGLYCDVLDGLNCHISFSGSVSAAVGLSAVTYNDVIIVDLNLPDGDGIEAIQEMRSNIKGKQPLIIVVTGSTDASYHQQAMDVGADKVLTKPEGIQQLKAVLEEMVN